MNTLLNDYFLLVLAVLVLVLGVGRLTRIAVHDAFPPMIWLRIQWDRLTKDGPWSKLAHCWWCASPWITAVAVGWFFLGEIYPVLQVIWWFFWGILAASYLAAMVISRDEPA